MANFYDLPGGHNFYGDAVGQVIYDSSGNTVQNVSIVSYQDVMTGATGGSPALSATTHSYPLSQVPISATGDAVVSAFAPFVDVYGVTAFTDANHGNLDPIRIWGYNMTTTTRTKSVAAEPAFGIHIETNYLNPSDSYNRHMEFYVNFNTMAGNPGTEDRVLNINYNPANGRIVGSSIRAAHAAYGGVFTVNNDTGIAGTSFFEVGYTASNGGNICGLRHYGNTGEDTLLELQAPASQNSKIRMYSNNANAFTLFTASGSITRVDVGSSSNGFQWAYNDGGMSVAINNTGNLAGLTVVGMSNAYRTIVAKGVSGQTLGVFVAKDSSDNDKWAIDQNGFEYMNTATLAAAGSALINAAALVAPFTRVTGADGTKCVKLLTAVAGLKMVVYNAGSSALPVFANSSDTVKGAASVSIPANCSAVFVAYDATDWGVVIGA